MQHYVELLPVWNWPKSKDGDANWARYLSNHLPGCSMNIIKYSFLCKITHIFTCFFHFSWRKNSIVFTVKLTFLQVPGTTVVLFKFDKINSEMCETGLCGLDGSLTFPLFLLSFLIFIFLKYSIRWHCWHLHASSPIFALSRFQRCLSAL